jgi:hypothetical protein
MSVSMFYFIAQNPATKRFHWVVVQNNPKFNGFCRLCYSATTYESEESAKITVEIVYNHRPLPQEYMKFVQCDEPFNKSFSEWFCAPILSNFIHENHGE